MFIEIKTGRCTKASLIQSYKVLPSNPNQHEWSISMVVSGKIEIIAFTFQEELQRCLDVLGRNLRGFFWFGANRIKWSSIRKAVFKDEDRKIILSTSFKDYTAKFGEEDYNQMKDLLYAGLDIRGE